jgi:hypothetical protein
MNKYIILKNFVDDKFIKYYINLSNKYNIHDSKVGTTVQPMKKIRKDLFFSSKDCYVADNIIFQKKNDLIKHEFNIDLKFRERYKLGTYYGTDKGFYIPHTDCQGGMRHRKLSIVICLSNKNNYEGGIFNLVNLNKKFKFDKGDAIIFDSNLLHGVEPVLSGVRQVLISFLWDEDGEKIRKKESSNKNSSTYTPNI